MGMGMVLDWIWGRGWKDRYEVDEKENKVIWNGSSERELVNRGILLV